VAAVAERSHAIILSDPPLVPTRFPDDDDGLAEQFRFALGGYGSGSDGHDSLRRMVRATVKLENR
jgi:hypothetical protein